MRKPTCHGRTNPDCTAPYHGNHNAYERGCRCNHAREDQRLYRKRLREGRQPAAHIDGTGTARRIQALTRIGWRHTDIAARLGCSQHSVWMWATMGRTEVDRHNAARVAALYRQLATVPGPSSVNRAKAAAKGWHSPMAWNNIDDPNEQPDVPLSTAGEALAERAARHAQRLEDFRALRAAGVGRKRIQDQLRVNSRLYVKLLAQCDDTTDQGQVAA